MINGKKINYVIATWADKRVNRNFEGLPERKDRYLSTHLSYLHKFKNNLDQITVYRPKCVKEGRYYEALSDFKNVVVIDGINEGFSYGQYLKTFDIYRDKFDFYIFCEDDYCPYANNFDYNLVEIFNELRKHEDKLDKSIYLCGLLDERGGRELAGISNGITDYHSLNRIFNGEPIDAVMDRLLFKNKNRNYQVRFSHMFDVIRDYRHKYSSYFHKKNQIFNYSEITDKHVFVPYEYVEGKYKIEEGSEGFLDRKIALGEDGYVDKKSTGIF